MPILETIAVDAVSAGTIAGVINRAFAVEAWFVDGDRITAAEIERLAKTPTGCFFVMREADAIVGCVYTEVRREGLGYIGLLAIEPAFRGGGLGPALMARAEAALKALGCQTIEITVVDLRAELFPFYERRGYRSCGTLPFPRLSKSPCHLVVMSRASTTA